MLIAVSANALERRKKYTETLVKHFDFIALEGIRHTCKAFGLPLRVVKQVKCLRSYFKQRYPLFGVVTVGNNVRMITVACAHYNYSNIRQYHV